MPRHLFIVSRETPYLADYMREQFSEEPNVEVVVDRRRKERRHGQRSEVAANRDGAERRQRPDLDRELRESFHVCIRLA